MRKKQKPLIIALEAIVLGESLLSGIGILALNYLKQILQLDSKNKYIVYSMRTQRHLNIVPGNCEYHSWKILDRVDRCMEKTICRRHNGSEGWSLIRLYFGFEQKCIRAALIVLQWFYKRWLPFSLWIHRADVYVSTSAYFYPPFFLSRLKKISFVYDLTWKLFPETMDPSNRKTMEQYAAKNIQKADQLVSISANTKKDIENLLQIHTNNTVIMPAADRAIFYPGKKSRIRTVKEKYGISKPYILSICTLEPRKNLKLLLRAFDSVHAPHKYELVFAGQMGWLQRELSDDVSSLTAGSNFILTGYVPNEDLSPLYSGAEVFVYPSIYEGFGLPVLEAMQCGCPVIASNTSSIPEVMGDAGLLVPTNDVVALTDALERILCDSNLREKMIEKGLKRSEQFSWETSVKRFMSLYM